MRKNAGILWLLLLSVVFGIVLSGCTSIDVDGHFVNNGKKYTYICGGTAELQGITLHTASMQELHEVLEECDIGTDDGDEPISTAEQAAERGVSVMEQHFDFWTEENRVVVQFNSKANVWIVSGQKQDRYSTNPTGVVALDPDTGRAVAIGLIE